MGPGAPMIYVSHVYHPARFGGWDTSKSLRGAPARRRVRRRAGFIRRGRDARRKLRDAEGFVGVRVDSQGAGRETADVDEEFGIVWTGDEAGFSADGFSVGEVFGRV